MHKYRIMLLNLLVLYTFIITLFKEIDNTSAHNETNTIQNLTNSTNTTNIPMMIELSTLPTINLSSSISNIDSNMPMNSTTSYQNLINSVLLTTAMVTGMSSEMNFSTEFSSSPSTFIDLYDNTTIDFSSTESTWSTTFNSSLDEYYTDFDSSTQSTIFDIINTTMETTTDYEYQNDDPRYKRMLTLDDELDDDDYIDYKNNNKISNTTSENQFDGDSTIVNDSIDNENETFYSTSDITTDLTTEFSTDGSTQSTDYSTVSEFTISTDFTTDSMSSTFLSTEFELSEFEMSTMNELIPIISSTLSTMPEQITDQNENPVNLSTTGEQHKICWETRFGQELVKLTVLDLVRMLFMARKFQRSRNLSSQCTISISMFFFLFFLFICTCSCLQLVQP